jgi:hypothetical protein
VSVVLVGVHEFAHALEKLVAEADTAARVATATGGHEIEREAKRQLGLKSHQAGTETPSEPGEPPALVTGTLRRSIHVEGPHPEGFGGWVVRVGPTVIYGRIQELGGDAGRGHAARLPARPYMKPAFEAVTPRLGEIYRAAWGRAIH